MAPCKTPGCITVMIDQTPVYNVPKSALLHFSTVAKSQDEQFPGATIRLPAECSPRSVHELAQWMQEAVDANNEQYPLVTPDCPWHLLELYATAIHMGIIPILKTQIEARIEVVFSSRELTEIELLGIEKFATEAYALGDADDSADDFLTKVINTLAYRLDNGLVPERSAGVDFISRSCPYLAEEICSAVEPRVTRYPLRNQVSFQGPVKEYVPQA